MAIDPLMSDASNPFELAKHEDLLDAGCEQLAIYLRWDTLGHCRPIYRLVTQVFLYLRLDLAPFILSEHA